MGEAKRRRQQDPNFGTPTSKKQIEQILRYVKRVVDHSLINFPRQNSIDIILTNKYKGFKPNLIEQFQATIRDYQFARKISISMLPEEYASLSDAEALKKLVQVY